MGNDDPYGVKKMNWMELEFYADGHDPMREKVAHARAEIRRREAEERSQARNQLSADVTRRISSQMNLQRENTEAQKNIIEMQAKLSQGIANKQLRLARASASAAALAAFATLMLAFISVFQVFGSGG